MSLEKHLIQLRLDEERTKIVPEGKTEAGLVTELYSLHEMRLTMSHSSLYHGVYMDQAILLNNQLRALTSRDYIEYSDSEIEHFIIEEALLCEEDLEII